MFTTAVYFPVDQAVLDDALMPSVLPLVKKEDITPMDVSSLQSASVFKVIFWPVAPMQTSEEPNKGIWMKSNSHTFKN